ncbi:hypothetical protein MKW92_002124 [Papaver armeniacum]|nr:hypothetical protein MKW92_002124 [Papaver armeniacum]
MLRYLLKSCQHPNRIFICILLSTDTDGNIGPVVNLYHFKFSVCNRISFRLALCDSEDVDVRNLDNSETEGVEKHVDSFMQLVALVERKSNRASTDLVVLSLLHNADELRFVMCFITIILNWVMDVLSMFLPLNDFTMSRLLSTIVRTHVVFEEDRTHSTFCSALGISSFDDPSLLSTWSAPDTDWMCVMENLDHEGLYFPSEGSFSSFMSAYRIECQVSSSSCHCVTVWNNGEAWICLDLLDVSCQLAETGHACSIRSVLDYPLKQCPEVFLFGLSQTNSGLLDVQNSHLESMIKNFDICQELKILSPVLDMAPFSFRIKLAALASGKGQINLSSIHVGVLQDVLQHSGAVVIAYWETVPIFIRFFKVMLGRMSHRFRLSSSDGVYADVVLWMLVRFEESPDKRELDIYNRKSHQLVTHLLLGVALRAVLDALHKSADSKMFIFGAKALEQFVDRLIEWPQYCSHILQSCHLFSTHSELVMFIECALAFTSSNYAESNGGSVVPTDHQGPNPVSLENLEVAESCGRQWGLAAAGTIQTRPQLSLSPFQLQQRNQGSPDDRHKSAGQQQLVVSTDDVVGGTQKETVAQPIQEPCQSSLAC